MKQAKGKPKEMENKTKQNTVKKPFKDFKNLVKI